MDTKKLDKWADLLLDTGKRNNLINFKDTKASTVEVLLPDPDALFEKIDGATAFEVFDPKIVEEDDDLLDAPEETQPEPEEAPQKAESEPEAAEPVAKESAYADEPAPAESAAPEVTSEVTPEETPAEPAPPEDPGEDAKKAEFLEKYSPKIKRQSQLLVYSISGNPIASLVKIDKKTREFIEETGVNVAYMAFGFINWKESETSSSVFHAPILLVPIQLSQKSSVDSYYIKSLEDDIVINPTFAYKLDSEHGIKLPEYADEGLGAYLEKVRATVAKLRWTVTAECKIGIFSFLKINMYRDLKDNAGTILANRNVRALLGEPIEQEPDAAADARVANPLAELHSVVDADSSQMEAIQMAKAGKSFVLQGPPGTGKSQTITNIVAECLGDGKKVLFVSEKLAALNVVYDKLRKAGLAEFCLELHSHKANKKDFIADLCHTLRAGKSSVSPKADAVIAEKDRTRAQLDAYAEELHKERPVIGTSLYELYEAHAAFRAAPDVVWSVPKIAEKGEAFLTDAASLLDQYVSYVPTVGYDYKQNPWHGFVQEDASYQAKAEVKTNVAKAVQFLQALTPAAQEIAQKYGVQCESVDGARVWKSFFEFAAESKVLTPALLTKENFDKAYAAAAKLRALAGEITAARTALDAEYDPDVYKLDGPTLYKKIAKQFASVFSRIFSSEYKQLAADLRLCRKDGKKPSYKQARAAAERLAAFQQKSEEFAAEETPVKPLLGPACDGVKTDWDYLANQLTALDVAYSKGLSFGSLAQAADLTSEKDAFAGYAKRLGDAFAGCDSGALQFLTGAFDGAVFNINACPCAAALERLQGCLDNVDALDNWRHFRQLLASLAEKEIAPFVDKAIEQQVEPDKIVPAFKKLFYYQWIDSILSSAPVLTAFSRVSQDKAIQIFSEKDVEQFEISKAKIRAELSEKRPSTDIIAPGSALATLLREGEKKRKQKSVRTLLAETGELVQRIKPCFLMSPLSVSAFLAPNAVHFDVVIFDEASQIFPQDAVGAIYRADQLIVVGDSRQMPPSNFFNASSGADGSDDEADDITDFESILDLCSTSMRQLRLRWHYRSRHEELITFSNKNFYDGDLVTFPSPKADAKGTGVDYFHVDGVFDRKSHTNRKEAEFVVDLIYENIEKFPNRSLGVVAFSIAQQDLIERILAKRRQNEPEKESFFRKDAEEPFFVKNLETVQGDERDTIIFSTAYGLDAQGKLLHNFGPLNRVGGERRLNVAVTRAKQNVQLVSSMRYTDIDLKRTSSEGARLLREYLNFAENGEGALEAPAKGSEFERAAADFEMEVGEFLRANGFDVDTQIGFSDFKIDVGVKAPGGSDYALAIESDGATYRSARNARDRDRLRREVLQRMGWRYYRLWSTDWFRNKAAEQERLLAEARSAAEGRPKKEPEPVIEAPKESYEEAVVEEKAAFPTYKEADIAGAFQRRGKEGFRAVVREILEVEAPVAEDSLLKRIAPFFGREKVTAVVQREFDEKMLGYERYGIVRKNGFLYLSDGPEVQFRAPGDVQREIKHIAPEELAAGMLQILKENVSADKNGLFRAIAEQCGVTRVGKTAGEALEAALACLVEQGAVEINGEQVSLK